MGIIAQDTPEGVFSGTLTLYQDSHGFYHSREAAAAPCLVVARQAGRNLSAPRTHSVSDALRNLAWEDVCSCVMADLSWRDRTHLEYLLGLEQLRDELSQENLSALQLGHVWMELRILNGPSGVRRDNAQAWLLHQHAQLDALWDQKKTHHLESVSLVELIREHILTPEHHIPTQSLSQLFGRSAEAVHQQENDGGTLWPSHGTFEIWRDAVRTGGEDSLRAQHVYADMVERHHYAPSSLGPIARGRGRLLHEQGRGALRQDIRRIEAQPPHVLVFDKWPRLLQESTLLSRLLSESILRGEWMLLPRGELGLLAPSILGEQLWEVGRHLQNTGDQSRGGIVRYTPQWQAGNYSWRKTLEMAHALWWESNQRREQSARSMDGSTEWYTALHSLG